MIYDDEQAFIKDETIPLRWLSAFFDSEEGKLCANGYLFSAKNEAEDEANEISRLLNMPVKVIEYRKDKQFPWVLAIDFDSEADEAEFIMRMI